MKVTKDNIGGKIIKDNEVYLLEDNCHLNNLILSKTTLHAHKETTGHDHPGVEEVYFFESGTGKMQLGNDEFAVTGGNIVIIPDGDFHKVFNLSDEDLIFITVFQTYKR